MSNEVVQLVESVERARTELLEVAAGFSIAEGAFRPTDGGWSIAEIVEHLYRAELSGVTKIWAALEQRRAGQMWDGELPNRGKKIEHIIAATWRPREVAPPVATPSIGGPLTAWISNLRSLRAVLHDLATELETVNLEELVFPHFLSGPLDARQRLEFLRFHLERHRDQIERVRSHRDFAR